MSSSPSERSKPAVPMNRRPSNDALAIRSAQPRGSARSTIGHDATSFFPPSNGRQMDRSFAYTLVHVRYTLPPAAILTFVCSPILSALDAYKILLLLVIALVYTTPWDAYLIRHHIWSYPPNAVIGTFLGVPLEELFFIAIQTYTTSLIYLLVNKSTLPASRIRCGLESKTVAWIGRTGIALCYCVFGSALWFAQLEDRSSYLSLICVWASPVLLLLWSIAYRSIISLPLMSVVIPICLPTLYLWVVDTVALGRGTWVISPATKLGSDLWPGLEIEEAFFFLISNTIVVCAMACMDHFMAVLIAFPSLFPTMPTYPSARLILQVLLTPISEYPAARVRGLSDAVARLKKKSLSFWIASGAFEGRLRVDLMLLYSFCRAADDLVDEAESTEAAFQNLDSMHRFLDLSYSQAGLGPITNFVEKNFPAQYHSALTLLPSSYLPRQPFDDLLEGFRSDLFFVSRLSTSVDHSSNINPNFPIKTEDDLALYAYRVAGTVAELCLRLVFYHCQPTHFMPQEEREYLVKKGIEMGIALQYVNIARDLEVDARMSPVPRIYLPATWLEDVGITADEAIAHLRLPTAARTGKVPVAIETLRSRLLATVMKRYNSSRMAVESVPMDWGARKGMRVAVESYMEIGRALIAEQEGRRARIANGRPGGVSKSRRLQVAWTALRG